MNRNYFFLSIAAILAIGLLGSCSSVRSAGKTASKDLTAERLLQRIEKQRLAPEWFESKIKIDYADGDMSVSGTGVLRMRKDSLMWLSVKKFGFEIARAKITKDSVYVLNRLQNEYTAEGLDYLAQSYGLPASLSDLQDFVLGNPIMFGAKDMSVEPLGPTYRLKGDSPEISTEHLFGADDFLPRKMQLSDKRNNQSMSALLEDYQPAEKDKNFSYLRKVELESDYSGNSQVTLQFSNVIFNIPNDTQFDIPSRYSKAK